MPAEPTQSISWVVAILLPLAGGVQSQGNGNVGCKVSLSVDGRQCAPSRCGFSIATVDDNLAPRCTEKRDLSG